VKLNYKVLKGLATLLKTIAMNRCDNPTIQEVQCLWMYGLDFYAAGNSDTEIGHVKDGLAGIGMDAADSIDYLLPCYVVLANHLRLDGGPIFPKIQVMTTQDKLWTSDDFPNEAELKELANRAGWASLLKRTKKQDAKDVEFSKIDLSAVTEITEESIKRQKDLAVLCGIGCEMYGYVRKKGKAGLPFRQSKKWGFLTAKPQLLELKAARGLRLVKMGMNIQLHAEQRLLYVLAGHLQMGGLPRTAYVGGCKVPCAVCRPVLIAFSSAYYQVYRQRLFFETSQAGQKKSNESVTLALPEPTKGDTSSLYYQFNTEYNRLIAG
jgi:hypothetical protein